MFFKRLWQERCRSLASGAAARFVLPAADRTPRRLLALSAVAPHDARQRKAPEVPRFRRCALLGLALLPFRKWRSLAVYAASVATVLTMLRAGSAVDSSCQRATGGGRGYGLSGLDRVLWHASHRDRADHPSCSVQDVSFAAAHGITCEARTVRGSLAPAVVLPTGLTALALLLLSILPSSLKSMCNTRCSAESRKRRRPPSFYALAFVGATTMMATHVSALQPIPHPCVASTGPLCSRRRP